MDYTVRALDTRDRFLFEAGPYEDALTAKHVADDFAGAEALSTLIDAGGTTQGHATPVRGVIINRAVAFGNGPGLPVIYDTAALDLSL